MLYYSFNTYLKERFGERVQKVTLDAGLTCPNRDGTRGTGGCIYCDAKGSGAGAHAAIPDLTAQSPAAICLDTPAPCAYSHTITNQFAAQLSLQNAAMAQHDTARQIILGNARKQNRPPYSKDGVDLSLIRWMLSLTPEERLQVLQQNVASIMRLRDAKARP